MFALLLALMQRKQGFKDANARYRMVLERIAASQLPDNLKSRAQQDPLPRHRKDSPELIQR